MHWDTETIAAAARAYSTRYALIQGDRQARADADAHFWAWQDIDESVHDGVLPIEVVDALLHVLPDDDGYLGYVAAGPIEDMLRMHPEQYTDTVAQRCREDAVWARAVGGVWLDRRTWEALPESLRPLIAEPAVPQQAVRTRTRAGRRPSKRQSRRGREH